MLRLDAAPGSRCPSTGMRLSPLARNSCARWQRLQAADLRLFGTARPGAWGPVGERVSMSAARDESRSTASRSCHLVALRHLRARARWSIRSTTPSKAKRTTKSAIHASSQLRPARPIAAAIAAVTVQATSPATPGSRVGEDVLALQSQFRALGRVSTGRGVSSGERPPEE